MVRAMSFPALLVTLGSRTGLETFAVWWLVGMTVFAIALAYTRHGLTRLEGAAILALYAVFVVVVASQ
jgi:Ca2+/Na+ antiporter